MDYRVAANPKCIFLKAIAMEVSATKIVILLQATLLLFIPLCTKKWSKAAERAFFMRLIAPMKGTVQVQPQQRVISVLLPPTRGCSPQTVTLANLSYSILPARDCPYKAASSRNNFFVVVVVRFQSCLAPEILARWASAMKCSCSESSLGTQPP